MFVIVNANTQMIYRKPGHFVSMSYQTIRGAKIACTKLNKQEFNQWVVMSVLDYENAKPVKMVERVNLMSGKKFMEAVAALCCSPAP